MDGEVGIDCAQSPNEAIIECLDGSLCSVDAMVMWFSKLEADPLQSNVSFDDRCCLIVHHIQFRLVTLFLKIFKILLKCFQDAIGILAGDWCG